jgi:integration host factor subunit alpha
VERLLAIMTASQAHGDEVLISGFGIFSVKQKRARRERNANAKESLRLPGRKVVGLRVQEF